LEGSRTSDPETDSNRLKYSWEQISGPEVLVKNKNSAVASFNSPENTGQKLVFKLTVTDGIYTSTNTVTFTLTSISGNIYTVNTNKEHMGLGACTLDQCTFRDAINAANNHVGRDTIQFNLPSDQLTIKPGFTQVVADPDNVVDLIDITDPVVVDGTSQPGFSGHPIVEIENPAPGQHVGINGLVLRTDNSVIKGLSIGSPLIFLACS